MRRGNVPGRGVGGGMRALAEVDAGFHLGQRLGEIEIGRGVVNRIGWREQDERVDQAGIDVLDQRGEVAEALVFRLHGQQRLAFAEVAERLVDGEREPLHVRRLARTGEHERLAGVALQIGGQRLDPCLHLRISSVRRGNAGHAECRGKMSGHHGHLAGGHSQTVVGHAAGERIGRLHRVETVHFRRIRLVLIAFALGLAAVEERRDRPLRVGAGEITVERDDAVGLGKIGHEADAIAGISGERLVLVEFRGGKFRRQLLAQAGTRRAVIGRENQADFRRLVGGQCGQHRREIRALCGFSSAEEIARAARRVEIEHSRLGEGVGAVGIRVQRVGAEFCRAAVEGGDHQRRGAGGARHGGGVVCRLAGDHPFGSLGVGDDVAFRAAAGGHAETSQRGGGAHQLQERATRGLGILLVGHLGGSLREFAIEPLAELRSVLKLTRTAPGNGGFSGGNFGVLPNALAHG